MIAFGPGLNGFQDVARQWPDEVGRRVAACVARGAAVRRGVSTFEEARGYQEGVRRAFWEGIGGLPGDGAGGAAVPPRGGDFLTQGDLEHLDLQITKLTFESLPGVPVSALLYRPAGGSTGSTAAPSAAPEGALRPGVLFLCGHHRAAKHHPEYHRVCLDLALHGLVVLAIDPWGQGERFQFATAGRDDPLVADGTYEHSYSGLPCFLTGGTISRYFAWDALRAVDVLCALPEVDPQRIGVTGNSGGGTQTVLAMMADDRVAAAMPCTYIHGMAQYYRTGQPHDAEQNFVGSLAHGIDHADLLACFAPRPLLVGAVCSDFFPIEATEESVGEARRVYEAFGAGERIALVTDDARHRYTDVLREHAVRFFIRELAGAEGYTRRDLPVLPEASLWCSPSGQLYRDQPQLRTIYDLNREYLAARRPAGRPAGHPEPDAATALEARLVKALGVSPADGNPVRPRFFPPTDGDGYTAQQVFFFSEPQIAVAGTLLRASPLNGVAPPPAGAASPGTVLPAPASDAAPGTAATDTAAGAAGTRTWLVLLPDGTASSPAALQEAVQLARGGDVVFVFDPRGRGAVRPHPISPRFGLEGWLGLEAWLAYVEMLMGRSTVASRVFDVWRAIDFLVQHSEAQRGVCLRAHGVAALWGYLAAALDKRVGAVHLTGMLPSWSGVAKTRLYDARAITASIALPRVLQHLDLPDLRPCFHGRDLRIEAPLAVDVPVGALPLSDR